MVQRRKVMILALALYWPTLFVLAHIPVPTAVVEARMSDKSLHYLMYMILTMLLWSVTKPYSKVNWRQATPWRILALIVVYAILDEYLQKYVVGRSADAKDFVADMLGASAGLLVLTFFSFWPSLLIALGSTIYILAVFTRANLTSILPVTATVFHLGTYGLFTLLWMGYMRHFTGLRHGHRLWFFASATVPLALMGATKLSTICSNKSFEVWDMVAGAIGIFGAIGIVHGFAWFCRKRPRTISPSEAKPG